MKDLCYTILISVFVILLVAFSKDAKEGAVEGLNLSLEIIVPSLLPMIVLTSTLAKSKSANFFEALFGKLTFLIFHLPKEASTAIIFGLIGGYPTGSLLTKELYQSGKIDYEDYQRIIRFNFCGGIGFIITTIGNTYLGSTKLGIIIYLINVLSQITIGTIEGIFYKGKKYYYQKSKNTLSIPFAFISSIESATKSTLIMCSYIIFFSATIKIIPFSNLFEPLLEITSGIFDFSEKIGFEYLCFFLSFGGICVHLQIIGITKTNYFDFLINRLISSTISYFLGKIYCLIFPKSVEVFSNIGEITPKISQINIKFSIVLLISSIVLILDIKSKKSKLI